MDFPWGSNYHQKFITNVGLITSDGPHGVNIMAAEWTYLVSYSPAHILISVGHTKATAENILQTKKFGVSIAAENQNWISSIAGGSSGKSVNKIDALKEMGATFSLGEKTKLPLVEGAALQAEVEVIQTIVAGDKTLFLGKVLTARTTEVKPLAYHENKYWKIDTLLEKPSTHEREKMTATVAAHQKK